MSDIPIAKASLTIIWYERDSILAIERMSIWSQ